MMSGTNSRHASPRGRGELSTDTLVCLARMPEAGKVKTRIASTDGPERALEIYLQLVAGCRKLLDNLPEQIDVEVSFAEPFDFVEAQNYFGTRPFFSQQSEGDLGQRMCVAAIRAFQSGARRVVLVGSDCPALTPEHLSQAFRILEEYPIVLGPAADGGYYLLGMTQIVPELFAELPWSTERLLPETLARLKQAGVQHKLLPVLTDIDTIEDWKRFTTNPSEL